MATAKIERLTNLVIALLASRGYLTAERIRSTVHGYADCQTDEAFARMFERDKSELRDLGIPLETGRTSVFDSVDGYRINRDDYALPDIVLTREEATAVAVASQLWEASQLSTATQSALLKLRAAGVDVDPDAGVTIATPAGPTGLRGADEAVSALLSAMTLKRAVEFHHRPSRTAPAALRTVEPWGVITGHGRWYLVGHDRDRDDTRVFRLSRIDGPVTAIGPADAFRRPAGIDLRAIVDKAVAETPTGLRATVWLAAGRATALRRAAVTTRPHALDGRAGDVVELEILSTDRLTQLIAGYGADAVALAPESLRDDVLTRLHSQAEAS